GDGDQSGDAEDSVAGGEVGFLLEDVVVLGALGGVFDLADLGALGGIGDVFDLLLADVSGGLVGAARGVDQGEGALDAGGQQQGCEEAGVDQGAGPLGDPEGGVVGGVGADVVPGLGDRDGPGGGQVAAEFAVPFEHGADFGVVGRAQDDGELSWGEPSGGGEVGCPECCGEGGHFLAQHGGGAA